MITETVHYVLDGSTILSETRKGLYGVLAHQLYYYYDHNGAPIGLNWNGQDYYYYKNIFGDVLGILDLSGNLVVRYYYDAWGNHIRVTGTMANTLGQYNPFRYRGYYYDIESGMYYLNARYYNPAWCRFISPDPDIDTSSAVGCNLFIYRGSILMGSSNNRDINNSIVLPETSSKAPTSDTHTSNVTSFVNGGATKNKVTSDYSKKKALKLRDVTSEVNRALQPYVALAQDYNKIANTIPIYQIYRYGMFGMLVNHGSTWDIKRKGPWESTIGTPFPGYGKYVKYQGIAVTPEFLGNFTYGFLGAAFGIDYQTLIDGSVFAAYVGGSMGSGAGVNNEIEDWTAIRAGYFNYFFNYGGW